MSEEETVSERMRKQAELVAVEIDDWAPLGGSVRFDLAGRRTVLVGRNGSGKSALLEGIRLGARMAGALVAPTLPAIDPVPSLVSPPKWFSVEIRDGQVERFRYQYSLNKRLSQRGWRGKDKVTSKQWKPLLSRVFGGLDVVVAGVPRQTSNRSKQVVEVVKASDRRVDCSYLNRSEPRIGMLAQHLVYARASGIEECLKQMEELGRRIGVWESLQVELYRRDIRGTDADPHLGSVTIDGVDLGLVADGTLRILEILWALLRADMLSIHLLLIEEPETGVHPGLLAGLLDTIDAYTLDRQVILSTHSPQVVSWAHPHELRVVTRTAGKTQVRPLTKQQVSQVLNHLHDQTLGDFVYSGALDDEE